VRSADGVNSATETEKRDRESICSSMNREAKVNLSDSKKIGREDAKVRTNEDRPKNNEVNDGLDRRR
jgi:hypothetical protein